MNQLSMASQITLHAYVATRSLGVATVARLREEQRGEGVISAAIAVLVMAFLGVMMWVAFKGIFQSAADNTQGQVDQIGG